MVNIPKKVDQRIKSNLTKYKRILKRAKAKDVNESDTVTIVIDILNDIMGYDKYSEITSEYVIKGTYCDLAIEIEDNLIFLVEVKRVGFKLKELHMRQAIDYATQKGIEYVILTNGINWKIYKVLFQKPIKTDLIFSLNLFEVSSKDKKVVEQIFSISKEGLVKAALEEIHEERRVINRYTIASIIMSEPILTTIKREIRKISKGRGVKIEDSFLLELIKNDILKFDVVEGEKPSAAAALIKKRMRKISKKRLKVGKEI
jgi:hypothetical protein